MSAKSPPILTMVQRSRGSHLSLKGTTASPRLKLSPGCLAVKFFFNLVIIIFCFPTFLHLLYIVFSALSRKKIYL